jgi:hypothetical protein
MITLSSNSVVARSARYHRIYSVSTALRAALTE